MSTDTTPRPSTTCQVVRASEPFYPVSTTDDGALIVPSTVPGITALASLGGVVLRAGETWLVQGQGMLRCDWTGAASRLFWHDQTETGAFDALASLALAQGVSVKVGRTTFATATVGVA